MWNLNRSVGKVYTTMTNQLVSRFAIFLCVLNVSIGVISSAGIVVQTRLGRVTGSVEIASQAKVIIPGPDGFESQEKPRYFAAFRGIPYAKPPVNERRWQDPSPYGPFERDLEATRYRSGCPQWDRSQQQVVGTEDCLFLNIYTPSSGSSQPGRPATNQPFFRDSFQQTNGVEPRLVALGQRGSLPVMLWIHGGAFMQGGAHLYGPEMLMREDVVLVTCNYRLGVLGFLSSGDKELPGNFAMLDVISALRWVKENIDDYGGDSGRITIFGESAGGAITHLLVVSPLAKGLFQQAIFQSGSATCEWTTEPDPKDYFLAVAKVLGCPVDQTNTALDCLKNKSPIELVKAQKDQLRHSFFPIRAAPVVDGNLRSQPFLPSHPRELLASGNFNKVPTISGVTKDEGLLFYLLIHLENAARMGSTSFLENDLLPNSLKSMIRNDSQHDATVRAVKRQYFANGELASLSTFIPKYSMMMEDLLINSCVYEAQLAMTKTQLPHYAYVFSYREITSPSYAGGLIDVVKRMGVNVPLLDTGVGHADDLLYLFKLPGVGFRYSATDMQVSTVMTRMWANFAKFGSPTGKQSYGPDGSSQSNQFWPPYTSANNVIFYNITALPSPMGADFRKQEFSFWNGVLPEIRDIADAYTAQNSNSSKTIWILLGLLIAAVVIGIILTGVLVYRSKRNQYSQTAATVSLTGSSNTHM